MQLATEITVEHVISASPEEIYGVWLDPESPKGPWVGDGLRRVDATEGGLYYWSDRNFSDTEGGLEWAHYGRFLELKAPSLIRYTWMSQFTHGLESEIRVQFEPLSGGTKVSLTQLGLPDGKDGLDHKHAWVRILGEMGSHFLSSSQTT